MVCRVASRSVAVALVLVALGGASATAARTPSVAPARIGVPVFVGSGFTPLAQVTVTLTTGSRTSTRRLRTNHVGGFVARFVLVALEPCRGSVVVRALDGHGLDARWKQQCRPPSTTAPFPSI